MPVYKIVEVVEIKAPFWLYVVKATKSGTICPLLANFFFNFLRCLLWHFCVVLVCVLCVLSLGCYDPASNRRRH